jgi:hypothetical protein
MKKSLSIFILIVFGLLTISSTSQDEDLVQKVTICHVPPGHPENAHPISISVNALSAHLAHGDALGDCSQDNKHVRGSEGE